MNRRWWLLAGVLGLCCADSGREMAARTPEKTAQPRWLSDWEEGRQAARRSGKPIFVVFRCEN